MHIYKIKIVVISWYSNTGYGIPILIILKNSNVIIKPITIALVIFREILNATYQVETLIWQTEEVQCKQNKIQFLRPSVTSFFVSSFNDILKLHVIENSSKYPK